VITEEVEGDQSLRHEMVEMHRLLDVTIARRKVTLEDFVQREKKKGNTLDRLFRFGKPSDGPSMSSEAALVEYDYELSDILIELSNTNDCEWIIDFRCSFHITCKCLWF